MLLVVSGRCNAQTEPQSSRVSRRTQTQRERSLRALDGLYNEVYCFHFSRITAHYQSLPCRPAVFLKLVLVCGLSRGLKKHFFYANVMTNLFTNFTSLIEISASPEWKL